MRQRSRGVQVWTGLGRCSAVAGTGLLVPAVWVAAVAVALWWRGPWAWIAPVLLACVATLALSTPVTGWFRALVEQWTGTAIPGGYRERRPVV